MRNTRRYLVILSFLNIFSKTISLRRIYPADGSHGSIADDKEASVVAYLEEFVDKLQNRGVKIAMITCGRGLSWLAGDTVPVCYSTS